MHIGEPLHDLAHSRGASAKDELFADGGFQLRLAALVALKDLCAKGTPGARHRQLLGVAGGSHQITLVISIALIALAGRAAAARSANKGRDLLFQDCDQGQPNGRPQLRVQHLAKIGLTRLQAKTPTGCNSPDKTGVR